MHSLSTINPRTIPWKLVGQGVYRKDILHDKKSGQFLSFFKINKGAKLKKHSHPKKEWVYVLDGTYEDEYGNVAKGMIKINAKGSVHTSKSRKGCTLLVFWSGKHTLITQ